MKFSEFETGLMAYVEKYVVPHLGDSSDRWLLYFGLAAGGLKLEQFSPMLLKFGIIDSEGNIDLDAMEKYGRLAFEKQSKVKIWKLHFNSDDFSVLMEHLRSGNPENA